MAQVNIAHVAAISPSQASGFARLVFDAVASEVHGLNTNTGGTATNAVSVLDIAVNQASSISGADSEVQVYISGNDWPTHGDGSDFTRQEAKVHFDEMAGRIHKKIMKQQTRAIYVWVTPFMASGWAE